MPLNGQCLMSGVVYQATVTEQDSGKEETHTGITGNQFKTRFNNHNSTFRHSSKRNNTSLSNYIWTLKDKQIEYKIRWEIIAKCQSYSPSTDVCSLCLREKYTIIYHPHRASLDNRNELTSECRHRKKYLLCNYNTATIRSTDRKKAHQHELSSSSWLHLCTLPCVLPHPIPS